MLFCLNSLMQPLVVAAAIHKPAGELVDNDNLAVLYNIVNVVVHDAVRADGLINVMGKRDILRVGKVVDIKVLLRPF